jgi:cobalt-zinc-cadmium efflux system protein
VSDHGHHHHLGVGGKLKYGIIFTGIILAVELVGGFLSNSLALLSDAGHVFADVIALTLSWYGVRQAERPASHRMTFGYHRVGVLIAIFNAFSIFAIGGVIFFEAYRRWQEPPEINSPLMLGAAIVGLAVNVFIAFWLRKEQRLNLNVRSAFWHVLGDALASVGVIIGAIIIMFTGLYLVDPIISVLIGFIIVSAAWRIFKEGVKVLLEATPHQVDVSNMIKTLKEIPGVRDVHDVHVWSISPELHAMSCHVLIEDMQMSEAAAIREKLESVLRGQFDIEHSALQFECQDCGCNDLFCSLGPAHTEHHEEHQD